MGKRSEKRSVTDGFDLDRQITRYNSASQSDRGSSGGGLGGRKDVGCHSSPTHIYSFWLGIKILKNETNPVLSTGNISNNESLFKG